MSPFQITQLSDRFPSVRIAALCSLIDCIRSVTVVPLSDANIFPEYILPSLMPLCHDRNDLVRAAFASNISVVSLGLSGIYTSDFVMRFHLGTFWQFL
jgi:phosphoinositide-3-kinase regulatory subunit 4